MLKLRPKFLFIKYTMNHSFHYIVRVLTIFQPTVLLGFALLSCFMFETLVNILDKGDRLSNNSNE